MSAEFFNTENARKVFMEKIGTDKHEDLDIRLVSIAVKSGIGYDKACKAASDILDVMLYHNRIIEAVRIEAAESGTEKVLDNFFYYIDGTELSNERLSRLYARIKQAEMPVSNRGMMSTADYAEVNKLLEKCRAMVDGNYDEVRAEIYAAFRGFNLNEKKLKEFLDDLNLYSLNVEGAVKMDAGAIRDHLLTNAITAMQLYLKNENEMTPSEAAVTVCTMKDASVFHEAVLNGSKVTDNVKDALLMWFLGYLMLAVVALAAAAFAGEEAVYMLATAGVLAAIGVVPMIFSKPISVLIGRSKVYLPNTEKVVLDNEEVLDDTLEDTLGLFDTLNYEQWDELTDNALVY